MVVGPCTKLCQVPSVALRAVSTNHSAYARNQTLFGPMAARVEAEVGVGGLVLNTSSSLSLSDESDNTDLLLIRAMKLKIRAESF